MTGPGPTMEKESLSRGPLVRSFLDGCAVVVVLLWGVLSFAPIYGILYGDQSAASLAIETAFLATGALGAAGVYAALLVMASDNARRSMYPGRGRGLAKVGAYAAVWIVLYGILA